MVSHEGKTPDMRRVEIQFGGDIRELLADRIARGWSFAKIGREFEVTGMTITNWFDDLGLRGSNREMAGAGR